MGIHLLFLFIHITLATLNDPVLVSIGFIVHCIVYVASSAFSAGKSELTVMQPYAFGAALVALANAKLVYRINQYGVDPTSTYSYVSIKHINEAAVLWSVGSTFIFIGYELTQKRSFGKISLYITNEKILNNIFKSVVILSLMNISGNIINFGFISGGIQKVMALYGDMSLLVFARLWGKTEKSKYRNYALILCALQILSALFTAYLRIQLVIPLLIIYGGYLIGVGKLKEVFSYRTIPVIAVFLVFFSMFGNLGANRSHFIDAFTSSIEVQKAAYSIDAVKNSDRNDPLTRSSNIAQISNIFKLVERNGYYNGEASLPIVYAFIPRIIWPEKPAIELGAWYALEIGVATINAYGRANNSVNMSIPGELYLDFGWLGVVLGCMGCGSVLAMFWNAGEFMASPYNFTGALWGGYLLLFCMLGIGSDLQIFVTFTSTFMAFFIVKKIVSINANSKHRSALAR